MDMQDAAGREAPPNELSGIEVDEVSLVDRPATGRRFVLFKRGGLLRRGAREENTNIGSRSDEPPIGRADLEALEKRAEDARAEVMGAMEHLRAVAKGLDERLAALERGHPARQSDESGPRASLWRGVL